MSICLVLFELVSILALLNAALLFTMTVNTWLLLCHLAKLVMRPVRVLSTPAKPGATYSVSSDEVVTINYFSDFQEIGAFLN